MIVLMSIISNISKVWKFVPAYGLMPNFYSTSNGILIKYFPVLKQITSKGNRTQRGNIVVIRKVHFVQFKVLSDSFFKSYSTNTDNKLFRECLTRINSVHIK